MDFDTRAGMSKTSDQVRGKHPAHRGERVPSDDKADQVRMTSPNPTAAPV